MVESELFAAYLEGAVDEAAVGSRTWVRRRDQRAAEPTRSAQALNDEDIFGPSGRRQASGSAKRWSDPRALNDEDIFGSAPSTPRRRRTSNAEETLPSPPSAAPRRSVLNDDEIFGSGPSTPRRPRAPSEAQVLLTPSQAQRRRATSDIDIAGSALSPPVQRHGTASPQSDARDGQFFVLGARGGRQPRDFGRSVGTQSGASRPHGPADPHSRPRGGETHAFGSRCVGDQRSDLCRGVAARTGAPKRARSGGATPSSTGRQRAGAADPMEEGSRQPKTPQASKTSPGQDGAALNRRRINPLPTTPEVHPAAEGTQAHGADRTVHGLPRRVCEVADHFEEPDWRVDPDPVFPNITPLAELCFRRAVHNSTKFGDLGQLPDSYMYHLLQNAAPESLGPIEAANPTNAKACDAAWSRVCKEKLGVEELDPKFPRWRSLYREHQREKQERMSRAAKRLREAYDETSSSKKKRTIAITGRVPDDPSRRVRMSSMRTLQRLRVESQSAGRFRLKR